MAELQVINTLQDKRKDIEAHIGSLERDLEQARRDLSAILAAIFLLQCLDAIAAPELRLHL